MFAFHQVGRNPDVGTALEDIWNYGGVETLNTTPQAMFISSSNAGDTTQTYRVLGLDADWELFLETVTVGGQSQVQIGTISWGKIMRAWQIDAGASPAGDIYIAESDTLTLGVPNTATKVHGMIRQSDGDGTLLKASGTVPAGHKVLIKGWEGQMLAATGGAGRDVTLKLMVQELANGATVQAPAWAPWRVVDLHTISTAGPQGGHEYDIPLVFPELTHVKVAAIATAASEVTADLSAVVVRGK